MDLKDLLTKKNIIALSLLVVTLIAIPAGAFLAQRTQIFKPRADAAILSVPGKASGQAYAIGETVNLQTTGSGNIGMAIYKGIDSPSKKWNPDNPAASGKTAADIEFKSGSGGTTMTGVVPFYLEYTVGSVTYGRAFESVVPVTTLTITDTTNNQAVSQSGPFVSGRSYKLKFEGSDNLSEGAGSVVIEGDPNKKGILRVDATGLSNASTKAEALAKNNGADWLAANKEVVRNNVLEFNLTAPFYLEYTSRDLNHNQEATKILAATVGATNPTKPAAPTLGTATCTNGTLNLSWTGGGPKFHIRGAKNMTKVQVDSSWASGGHPIVNQDIAQNNHTGTSYSLDVGGANNQFYTVWIHSVGDDGTVGDPAYWTNPVTCRAPDTASCTVTGSNAEMKVGDTRTFSAIYSSNNATTTYGEINVWNSSNRNLAVSSVLPERDWVGGDGKYSANPATHAPATAGGNTITFSPKEAGVYRVACRASNGNNVECKAPSPGIAGGTTPVVSCGNNSFITVNVEEAPGGGPTNTPTVTLSPSISASPTISLSPAAAPNQIKLTLSVDRPEKRVGEVVEIPVTFQTLVASAQVRIIDFTIKYDQNKFQLVDTNGFVPEPGTGFQSTCPNPTHPACSIQPFAALGQIKFLTTRTAPDSLAVNGPFKLGTIKLKAISQTAANEKTKVELIGESINSLTAEQLPTEKVPVELEIKDKIFTKQFKVMVVDGVLTKAAVDADTTLIGKFAAITPQEYKNADGSPEPIKVSQLSLVNVLAPATSGPKTVLVQFEDYSTPPITALYFKTLTLAPNPSVSQVACTQSAFDNSTIVTIFGNNLGTYDRTKNTVKVANQAAEVATNGWIPLSQASASVKAQVQADTSPDTVILATLKNKRIDEVVPIEVKTADGKTVTSSCGIDTSVVSFQAIPQCRSGDFTLTNVSVKIAPLVTIIYGNTNLQPALVSDTKINIDKEGNPQTFAPKLEKGKKYAMLIKAPKYLAKRLEFTATDGTFCANSEDGECKPITLRAGDISGDNNLPDGKVNASDYGRLIAEWILDKDASRNADINGDNRVNSVDYACLRLNFNQSDDILNAVSVRPTSTLTPTVALTAVPFIFSTHTSHSASGHRLLVQGGTSTLTPTDVRLVDSNGNVVSTAQATSFTSSEQLCGSSTGVVKASLTIPQSPSALGFTVSSLGSHKLEAKIGQNWHPTQITGAGCSSIE